MSTSLSAYDVDGVMSPPEVRGSATRRRLSSGRGGGSIRRNNSNTSNTTGNSFLSSNISYDYSHEDFGSTSSTPYLNELGSPTGDGVALELSFFDHLRNEIFRTATTPSSSGTSVKNSPATSSTGTPSLRGATTTTTSTTSGGRGGGSGGASATSGIGRLKMSIAAAANGTNPMGLSPFSVMRGGGGGGGRRGGGGNVGGVDAYDYYMSEAPGSDASDPSFSSLRTATATAVAGSGSGEGSKPLGNSNSSSASATTTGAAGGGRGGGGPRRTTPVDQSSAFGDELMRMIESGFGDRARPSGKKYRSTSNRSTGSGSGGGQNGRRGGGGGADDEVEFAEEIEHLLMGTLRASAGAPGSLTAVKRQPPPPPPLHTLPSAEARFSPELVALSASGNGLNRLKQQQPQQPQQQKQKRDHSSAFDFGADFDDYFLDRVGTIAPTSTPAASTAAAAANEGRRWSDVSNNSTKRSPLFTARVPPLPPSSSPSTTATTPAAADKKKRKIFETESPPPTTPHTNVPSGGARPGVSSLPPPTSSSNGGGGAFSSLGIASRRHSEPAPALDRPDFLATSSRGGGTLPTTLLSQSATTAAGYAKTQSGRLKRPKPTPNTDKQPSIVGVNSGGGGGALGPVSPALSAAGNHGQSSPAVLKPHTRPGGKGGSTPSPSSSSSSSPAAAAASPPAPLTGSTMSNRSNGGTAMGIPTSRNGAAKQAATDPLRNGTAAAVPSAANGRDSSKDGPPRKVTTLPALSTHRPAAPTPERTSLDVDSSSTKTNGGGGGIQVHTNNGKGNKTTATPRPPSAKDGSGYLSLRGKMAEGTSVPSPVTATATVLPRPATRGILATTFIHRKDGSGSGSGSGGSRIITNSSSGQTLLRHKRRRSLPGGQRRANWTAPVTNYQTVLSAPVDYDDEEEEEEEEEEVPLAVGYIVKHQPKPKQQQPQQAPSPPVSHTALGRGHSPVTPSPLPMSSMGLVVDEVEKLHRDHQWRRQHSTSPFEASLSLNRSFDGVPPGVLGPSAFSNSSRVRGTPQEYERSSVDGSIDSNSFSAVGRGSANNRGSNAAATTAIGVSGNGSINYGSNQNSASSRVLSNSGAFGGVVTFEASTIFYDP